MKRKRKSQVIVRTMKREDIPAMAELSRQIYPNVPWTIQELTNLFDRFGQGQLVAVERGESNLEPSFNADSNSNSGSDSDSPPSEGGAGGGYDRPASSNDSGNTADTTDRIVGFAASLIVRWDDYEFTSSWNDMTEGGTFTNHDPEHGRTLYGVEVMVDPAMQGRGIGKLLYKARRELCRSLNLKRIRGGARLANYHLHEQNMSVEEYIIAVVNGELGDPTLSFQIKQGFRVLSVVHNYMPRDTDSGGHAVVIEWINHRVAARSDYRRRDPRFGKRRKRKGNSGTQG